MILIHRDVVKLISVVYFMQGAVGIAGIALPLYLRSSGFSVKEIAYYMSVVGVPWFLKVIYGAISDAFPIFGHRRKPYIIICCSIASLGWFLMAMFPPKMAFLIVAMVIANIGFAATDVVTDGIVVEHSTAYTSKIYQGISWGSRSVGSLMSGVIGGYLAAKLDDRIIFALTGVLPLFSVGFAAFYHERKKVKRRFLHFAESMARSFKELFRGDLGWLCLLLIVVSFSASFFTPLFFHMREQLGFSEKLLGLLNSITWAGGISGCFLYLNFFKRVKLKNALYMAVGIGFFEILFCLLINNQTTAMAVFFIGGVLGYLSLLPLMSSAAKLAHGTGVESSLFAILMGIFNLGQSTSTFWGGWLSEKVGLHLLIIMTACLTLTGMFVIRRIKSL